MKMGQIKITALWDNNSKDDTLQYILELSNNFCKTTIEIYDYDSCFKDFGNSLMNFPLNINDKVCFEIGEDIPSWAYYLLLKVYCYEMNGNSAIQVVIDNHYKAPFHVRSDFNIISHPASLNKLGKLLIDWNPKEQKQIIWDAE
jgi:hypothetical protein